MAKVVVAKVKLQIPGGKATPAPPVGPALGQHQVNIGEFVRRFNDLTRDREGTILPVEIFIHKDRSFDLIIKSPPAAVLLKKAAEVAKGSSTPKRENVGKVTRAQLQQIAEVKMADLNASTIERASRIIAGTAKSMGIEVID